MPEHCTSPARILVVLAALLAGLVSADAACVCRAPGATCDQKLCTPRARAPERALLALRGGDGEQTSPDFSKARGPSKLQRSYSISAIVPPAADPSHLRAEASSGDMDVHMVTTRKERMIEATISSKKAADFIKSGHSVYMHWAVDPEDNGEWHRPPKEMLPEGTNYRYKKHSVQTKFVLDKEGGAQVVLTVPDGIAPRKLRFICFVHHGEGTKDVWFKNANEGDFEMVVVPEIWRQEIEEREAEDGKKDASKASVTGIFGFLTGQRAAPQHPLRQTSNLTEGVEQLEETGERAPSPPRSAELDGSWRPHRKLQRSKSAEIRHLNKEKRMRLAEDAKSRHRDDRQHVKLSVMLPLDLHKWRITSLERRLVKLKEAGVHGVMCDLWWGLVEDKPKQYDFTAYTELVKACERIGLEVEFVMSFHRCGGNVGDSCTVPLPRWVSKCANQVGRDVAYYTDRHGTTNDEYLSLAVDEKPFLEGRTPVQVYEDYMTAFVDNFHQYFHKTISKVQIGLGPAGELRYPSFPLTKWCYPGPGSFQCYDKGMKESWAKWCRDNHKKDWQNHHPDTGGYNTEPGKSKFWREAGNEYGKAFLKWYSDELLAHGARILSRARDIFEPFRIEISGKIAGLHWLYSDPTHTHSAECCAGYYNTNKNDAYANIARMFKSNGATFDFTCIEIPTGRDKDYPYYSDPEGLVWQAKTGAEKAGCKFAGENALPVDSWEGYDMILRKAKHLDSFCFLRLNEDLIGHQYNEFKHFAHKMHPIKRPQARAA
mmetsp:Transcript_14039/g.35313  ORF Transcript_14039/g.35313 Transcript_14039/m.35313 type:complete len:769 (+) Transcript_14039:171-2477(+)